MSERATPRVLGLETATGFLSLGWLQDDLLEPRAGEFTVHAGRAHAERIVPELHAFMRGAGLERADLIAVGVGPGSYTGVRVGVSLALGLARGWGARVVGVPTLESIAAAHEGLVAIALDARKGNVYSAVYRVENGRIAATLLEPAKRPADAFSALVPEDATWLRDETAPSGAALARLGLERSQRGDHRLEISYL